MTSIQGASFPQSIPCVVTNHSAHTNYLSNKDI